MVNGIGGRGRRCICVPRAKVRPIDDEVRESMTSNLRPVLKCEIRVHLEKACRCHSRLAALAIARGIARDSPTNCYPLRFRKYRSNPPGMACSIAVRTGCTVDARSPLHISAFTVDRLPVAPNRKRISEAWLVLGNEKTQGRWTPDETTTIGPKNYLLILRNIN
jgi:hypothetical protein